MLAIRPGSRRLVEVDLATGRGGPALGDRLYEFLGHPNQFGHGPGPHLLHHVGAMELHGRLGHRELRDHLFVEHALHQECHHFALARREGLVTAAQLRQLASLPAVASVAFEGVGDRVEQILVSKWLRQEVDRAGLHGLYGHRDVAVPGDEDDGHRIVRPGELALQVQPAQTRQPDVQDEATGYVRTFTGEKVLRRRERLDAQSDGLDELLGGAPDRRLVVHDIDDGLVRVYALWH